MELANKFNFNLLRVNTRPRENICIMHTMYFNLDYRLFLWSQA